MANIVIIYSVLLVFIYNCADLMVKRFSFDVKTAGKFLAGVYMVATFSVFFLGYAVDKLGRRIKIINYSSVILIAMHLYTAILPDSDEPSYWIVLTIIGAGLIYAVYAAVCWPCISMIVDEKIRGSAFGLAFAV